LISYTTAFLELMPSPDEFRHHFANRLWMALDTQKLHRGASYGATNNSTIPTTRDVALELGVQPPAEVPASRWKLAYNVQKCHDNGTHY
jgi:hypothetical protein